MNSRYILGIDTSNYKTSVAVTDRQGNVICDKRKFLSVKQGERGLRQSDALFQHIKNIPELTETVMKNLPSGNLKAIAYSSKPRPVENSYMPVFLAGESFARTLSAAMGIPVVDFSHQEGHIEAIKFFSKFKNTDRLLACHFSGGTCELLSVQANGAGYDIDIIGGSKDISFGQVIDRAGVQLGMSFPAGEEMDNIASETKSSSKLLTAIKVKDAWLNLSGIDTQIKRVLKNTNVYSASPVIRELFEKTADAMVKMIVQGVEKTGIRNVIMAGGVTSSIFIKSIVKDVLTAKNIDAEFGSGDLAQDNAVGIALLGGKRIWA